MEIFCYVFNGIFSYYKRWYTPVLHITNGNCCGRCSRPRGSVGYVGRLRLAPTPPSPTFCQPWSCYASPYLGWQNVSYLERYVQVCLRKIINRKYIVLKLKIMYNLFYLSIFIFMLGEIWTFYAVWLCAVRAYTIFYSMKIFH